MCGLVGFLDGLQSSIRLANEELLTRMSDKIINRGPDDSGYWSNSLAGIGLGHRRLSILDLSLAGHQPMLSEGGRFVLVYNGEIYNHLKIRTALEKQGLAPNWRGHSDTETLLAGFTAWGVQNTIEQAIGMFAFAVWDQERDELILGRDRGGEKPLYYGWQGQGSARAFLFGSELKALKAHPAFSAKVDRGALALMMRHNCVPAPYSIYENIYKLEPGCLLTVSRQVTEPKITQYWSLSSVASFGIANPVTCMDNQAVDLLEDLLKSAVGQQMLADVPLGAFLSGGIDSSTIVAMMQTQSQQPVKTFTIGFEEQNFNEAVYAKAVAKHLGTDHTELYVNARQTLDVIPKLPSIYCEPFSDSSQIPTFLVSQLARADVKVSLTGDAGDELFCGYTRYVLANQMGHGLSKIPAPLKSIAASVLGSLSPATWNSVAGPLRKLLPDFLRLGDLGNKFQKAAGVLASPNTDALYEGLVSHWHDPASVVLDGIEPATWLKGRSPSFEGLDSIQRMMALDFLTYLPDDILVKVDRAAMGVSLESRVPFLDHRVVEFAWRLPQHLKLRDGVSKWALRQVLYRHVPKELIERPKMGFGIPIGEWLRGPLKDWAEELLDETRLKRDGYFNPIPIRQKWVDHLAGRHNWEGHLWDVLMFQAWLDEQ